jgi:hypothetical protein
MAAVPRATLSTAPNVAVINSCRGNEYAASIMRRGWTYDWNHDPVDLAHELLLGLGRQRRVLFYLRHELCSLVHVLVDSQLVAVAVLDVHVRILLGDGHLADCCELDESIGWLREEVDSTDTEDAATGPAPRDVGLYIYLSPGVDPISIDAGQTEAEMTCDQSRRR